MNILILNHYAGSPLYGMEYRPYYLAREWQRLGHEVTIIAADHSHVRRANPVFRVDFEEEMHHGVRYVWVKTPDYSGNGISRVRNMFTFTLKTEFKAKQLAKTYNPDVVIASSTYPWDNYSAKKIANHSGAQYFYEVHDLWPLSPMELGGMSKYHPFIMLMQRAENFAYKHADKVISMLPKTLDYMVSHGLKPEKWHYLPNGFVMEDWVQRRALNSKTDAYIQAIKAEYKVTVAYTGTLGLANALDSYIDAAKLRQDVAFLLVGAGPEREYLFGRKEQERIQNLFFIPAIPKVEIPDLLSKFDILYIGLQSQNLFRFGISPNKLIDYMMAQKPIIQAIDAGNSMVDEANCGISVQPENPESIVQGVDLLMSKSEAERKELGENGADFAKKNHDYQKLAERFIQIVEK